MLSCNLFMSLQKSEDRPTFESLHFRLEDFFASEAANYTSPEKLMEAAKLQEKEEQ